MKNFPIGVGLVGFGVAGRVMHAPFLSSMEQFRLVSILERSQSHASAAYPDVAVVRTMDAMLKDPSVELIVIATPNTTHFELAAQSLLAQKHVVVDKPFTVSSLEAESLISLAQQTGRILSVYQNRRFVNDFLTIRKIIDEGLLGRIVEFQAHYDRYRPAAKSNAWREKDKPGSGILFDLGSHLIDQALVLFGIPQTITADIRKQRSHAAVDDYFNIRLDYGFTNVILQAGMLVREPGPRYMVHGLKGSYIKYGDDPQEALLRNGDRPCTPDWGREPEMNWGILHTIIDGVLVRRPYPSIPGNFGTFYTQLYETIFYGRPLKVTPQAGFNTVKLIELAFESQAKKCTIPCDGLLCAAYS